MQPSPKAVVVLAGARDHYQLPLALQEGGLLQSLATDMYWPADRQWFSSLISPFLPQGAVSARYCPALGSGNLRISVKAWAASALMQMAPQLKLNPYKNRALGKTARQLALRDDAPLFSTTYYAFEAFKDGKERPKHRLFFQLQAHAKTLRQILVEEMERTPTAKQSLAMEYELSLPDREFEELSSEPHLATGWVATSNYAAQTLSEHGVPGNRIHVVPYGVDSKTFVTGANRPDIHRPLRVVFVGALIQRKGLSYLLEAVRSLRSKNIQLIMCTRGLIDRQLLAGYSDTSLEIKVGLSGSGLAYELHNADVFVFPSLCEGFAHVILQAMSCGVPVITTTHTCAPDVMTDGIHGFIVPIRSSEAIAAKLTWAMEHRPELAQMGEAAGLQARLFTWERFRAGVREAYKKMVNPEPVEAQTHFV